MNESDDELPEEPDWAALEENMGSAGSAESTSESEDDHLEGDSRNNISNIQYKYQTKIRVPIKQEP